MSAYYSYHESTKLLTKIAKFVNQVRSQAVNFHEPEVNDHNIDTSCFSLFKCLIHSRLIS